MKKLRFLSLGLAGIILTINSAALAQIIPDTTLPVNSVVTPAGNNLEITGGTTAGTNLFHSFQQFSVINGVTAHFNNAANIQNIITRVTGTLPSNIDGTLKAENSANLFLINPNGIIFGSNAQLDIKAAFVATTANAIGFGSSGYFGANTGNNVSLLTVNPSAFLFNQIGSPQSISSQARLQVPTGMSLLLVGGNINLNASALLAPGGRVELGGLAQNGVISLNMAQNNLILSFSEAVQRADVSIDNASQANVRAGGGGSIAINAHNLNILGASRVRAGIGAGLGIASSVAGDVNINATGAINIDDRSSISDVMLGTGKSGNINVTTASLSLTNGGQLIDSTYGDGDAGSITIRATNQVSMDGVGSNGFSSGVLSNVEQGAVGNSAGMKITAAAVSLTNGAQLQSYTAGEGNAGNIIIHATDKVAVEGVTSDVVISGAFSTVEEDAIGNGGDIDITARFLSITDGAELQASTRAQGNAGSVLLNITDAINIFGVNPQGFSSGLFSNTNPASSGQGGLIKVQTNTLQITDGAVLAARSQNAFNGGDIAVNVNKLILTGGGQILTTGFNGGNAGSISINAKDNITISGFDPTFANRLAQFGRPTVDPTGSSSGIFADTETNSTGLGGSIFLATKNLNLRDNASISVDSRGTGNGGNLLVKATDLFFLDQQASLLAGTASGEGGNIKLETDSLLLMRHNSLISTTAGGIGNGGDILINAPLLVAVASENSDIRANAFKGRGGNINITTQSIFGFQFPPQNTPESDITASSQFGINGSIQINTPGIDPSKSLTQLPSAPVDLSGLIASGCQSQKVAKNNQFIITGRGGLPTNPMEPLSSDIIVANLDMPTEFRTALKSKSSNNYQLNESSFPQSQLVEAQGWNVNTKGQIVLTTKVSTPIAISPNSNTRNYCNKS